MKIVITVEKFDPTKGYLEYYLSKELTNLGHKIIIITFCNTNKLFYKNIDGFNVIYLPYIKKIYGYHFFSLSTIIFIYTFLKQEKPHIIHCQPLFSPLAILIILLNNNIRSKIVGSIRTSEKKDSYNVLENILILFIKITMHMFIIKNTEIIYSKSVYLKNSLIKEYRIPNKMIHIIPLGADHKLFKFDITKREYTRKYFGFKDSDIIIVYSGKIIPSKGLPILLRALKPIMIKNKNIILLVVGEGPPQYISKLKLLIMNLNIYENIVFHPWVHRIKLPEIYCASDIAVWPGSISISILEAAAVNLPLIIKDTPLTYYKVSNNNGFVYDYGDVIELRNYLKLLIYNKELREKMGKNSRILIEKKLNWKIIAFQYIRDYNHILCRV